MGKNKLKKFSEVEQMKCVFQYPFRILEEQGFPMRGQWGREYFHNDNPIVLELGCGKGEYTVGLAERFPDKNFIGIDIKGARIWSGARQVTDRNILNAAFLRTSIELIPFFFAPGEVDEIWITFPDPQMKKVNKRLTGTRFMNLYRKVMKPDGIVHLKTDSPFLYKYTGLMTGLNRLKMVADTADLYASPEGAGDILGIRTFYEQQWLARGKTIKYLAFRLPRHEVEHIDEDDIERDDYHAVSRGNFHETPSK